jgi:hypothetical protein
MLTSRDNRVLGFFVASYVLVVLAVAIATVFRYVHG